MKVRLGVLVLSLATAAAMARPGRVINGVEVPQGLFREVVRAEADGATCTATIVGERAVLSAAHCFRTGQTVKLTFEGRTYRGEAFRHPDYPAKDVDLALIVTETPLGGANPVSLGGPASAGQRIFLLGYGCTNPGGGGTLGKLHMGESTVTQITGDYVVSRRPDGGALCFGDSGGPTLEKESGRFRILGINSKGNIQDTNYSLHLAADKVRAFLQDQAQQHGVDICGLTATCDGPAVGIPQFKKPVFAYSLLPGAIVEQRLVTLLKSPVAGLRGYLDPGAPAWMRIEDDTLVIEAPKHDPGDYEASLTVRNASGADAALIRVRVTGALPQPPACELKASPSFVRLGESLDLILTTSGAITSAGIDGNDVPAGGGQLTIRPSESGVFLATGAVSGPGGSATCAARYGVK